MFLKNCVPGPKWYNYSVKIIEEALNRNKHVLGIFIDLSKAFDTIDHEKLLTKLDRFGIRSNAHNLKDLSCFFVFGDISGVFF